MNIIWMADLGLPIAVIRTSAFEQMYSKFFECEWQTVTVAFSSNNKPAKGLPTMLLLPTITTFAPSKLTFERFNNSTTAAGVQFFKLILCFLQYSCFF